MEHAEGYERRWWILGVLCLSLLVIGLDNTILNVAIPTLVRDLGASNSQLQWIVDSYTLVFACLLLTAGSLSDKYGRRSALALGLVIFGGGSLASAFAGSATMLIFTRALMGVGGALIMPSTLSILTNVFPAEERGRAIGIWAGVSGLGIGIGPVVGGWLLTHFWWGSVFLVNVPVVIFALIAGRLIIPNSKDPSAPRLDPVGAVLSIVGLFALVYGIIEAPSNGWTDPMILVSFTVAAIVLASFVVWERRSDHPMLNLEFFKNPRFTAANISITLGVLRAVRIAVLPDAVPPVRAWLLGAAGRLPGGPDRSGADRRLPDHRPAREPGREQGARGDRHGGRRRRAVVHVHEHDRLRLRPRALRRS